MLDRQLVCQRNIENGLIGLHFDNRAIRANSVMR